MGEFWLIIGDMRNALDQSFPFEELLLSIPPGDDFTRMYWLAAKLHESNRCWPTWAVLSRAQYMVFTFATMKEFYSQVHQKCVASSSGSVAPKWHEAYDLLLGLSHGSDRAHEKMCVGDGPTVEEGQKLGNETARVPSVSLAYAGLYVTENLPLPSFSTAIRELKRLRFEIRKIAEALCSVDQSPEIFFNTETPNGSTRA